MLRGCRMSAFARSRPLPMVARADSPLVTFTHVRGFPLSLGLLTPWGLGLPGVGLARRRRIG